MDTKFLNTDGIRNLLRIQVWIREWSALISLRDNVTHFQQTLPQPERLIDCRNLITVNLS